MSETKSGWNEGGRLCKTVSGSARRVEALGHGDSIYASLWPYSFASCLTCTSVTLSQEKGTAGNSDYRPKFFDSPQWHTLRKLCDLIIPSDEKSGGALEANAPEFIDLLTGENKDFQFRLAEGLARLDNYCSMRYGNPFLACPLENEAATLDLLAYGRTPLRKQARGLNSFSFLRDLTIDGLYTS